MSLVDDPAANIYPMPLTATGLYDVEVRIFVLLFVELLHVLKIKILDSIFCFCEAFFFLVSCEVCFCCIAFYSANLLFLRQFCPGFPLCLCGICFCAKLRRKN